MRTEVSGRALCTHFMSQESVVHASLRLAHGPQAKGPVIATSRGSEGIDWTASGTSSPERTGVSRPRPGRVPPGRRRRDRPESGVSGALGARSTVEIEGRHVDPMRACRGGLQQPGLRAFPDGQELRFSGPSAAPGDTRRDSLPAVAGEVGIVYGRGAGPGCHRPVTNPDSSGDPCNPHQPGDPVAADLVASTMQRKPHLDHTIAKEVVLPDLLDHDQQLLVKHSLS